MIKNIHEQILYDISASVLGMEEFDEELFKAQIRHITVFNDNRLVFSFYDGREEERRWQDPSLPILTAISSTRVRLRLPERPCYSCTLPMETRWRM